MLLFTFSKGMEWKGHGMGIKWDKYVGLTREEQFYIEVDTAKAESRLDEAQRERRAEEELQRQTRAEELRRQTRAAELRRQTRAEELRRQRRAEEPDAQIVARGIAASLITHDQEQQKRKADSEVRERTSRSASRSPRRSPEDEESGEEEFHEHEFNAKANVKPKLSLVDGPHSYISREVGGGTDRAIAKQNAVKKGLGKKYRFWRQIGGDGNCCFRSVSYSFLEHQLGKGQAGDARIRDYLNKIGDLPFRELLNGEDSAMRYARNQDNEEVVEELRDLDVRQAEDEYRYVCRRLEALMRTQSSEDRQSQFKDMVMEKDNRFDRGLIRILRYATATHMKMNADKELNGLPYRVALECDNKTVKDYISKEVLKMDEQTEHLALIALAEATGIKIIVEALYNTGEMMKPEPYPSQFPLAEADAFLFFKPGHYDILYPKK